MQLRLGVPMANGSLSLPVQNSGQRHSMGDDRTSIEYFVQFISRPFIIIPPNPCYTDSYFLIYYFILHLSNNHMRESITFTSPFSNSPSTQSPSLGCACGGDNPPGWGRLVCTTCATLLLVRSRLASSFPPKPPKRPFCAQLKTPSLRNLGLTHVQ